MNTTERRADLALELMKMARLRIDYQEDVDRGVGRPSEAPELSLKSALTIRREARLHGVWVTWGK